MTNKVTKHKQCFLLARLSPPIALVACSSLWLCIMSGQASFCAATNSHAPVVVAFAAKKKPSSNKKQKGGNAASSNKGFGAAPPTLEEVTSKFKTRLPENSNNLPCPCGNMNGAEPVLYANCCAPYHGGEKPPETPLRVLQTRYSAFAYRLVPYIIQTTHRTCRDYRDNLVVWAKDLNSKSMFDSYDFVQLEPGVEIIDPNNPNRANIDFKVRVRARDGTQQETIISEKSVFLRDPETNSWLYASGEVRSEVAGLEDTILNP